MLASFDGTWNWTAIGTLALAVATFVSLFFARRSIKQTQDQIEIGQQQLQQTQREIELSRREVEEAQRPLIVPVVAKTFVDLGADGQYEKRPQVVRNGKLLIHVENVGPGPALNVAAWASLLDDAGQPSTGSSGPQLPAQAAGLGPHTDAPLLLEVHNWTGTPNFALRVEYDDVASNGWRTDALFVAGTYEVTAIGRCERQRSASRMIQPVAQP
ncbi:MAG TPA: hypothetical protein VIH71_10840 [Solirubrobacteraceae bacterium]